ncbi:alpha/beta hydrolase [Nocardioides dubius]|uniref:Alpha/beta hydrolase n=1 Tax=Nocardioides dubius TaxID=317019 RepID=A0ABP4EB99_9ACTN
MQIHEGSSARSLVVRTFARTLIKPTFSYFPSSGPLAYGLNVLELGARVIPRDRRVSVEPVIGEGWVAELVQSRAGADENGAIVYFHGGGFLFCGVATHRRIVEQLALRTGLPVLSVAYRQSTKGLVETSIADCIAATDWLIERGIDPERIVVAGDSAGGHLSFQVAIEATQRGVPLAGVVGLSPWLDFDNTVRRTHPNARRDHYIPSARLGRIARQVTGRSILEPGLSPVNRDLRNMPPSLIVCAADEVLRHDAELMTERLEAVGAPVDLHIWSGQIHAFPVMGALTPESSACLDLISGFVQDQLGISHLRSVRDIAV